MKIEHICQEKVNALVVYKLASFSPVMSTHHLNTGHFCQKKPNVLVGYILLLLCNEGKLCLKNLSFSQKKLI